MANSRRAGLSSSLGDNQQLMERIFAECDDVMVATYQYGDAMRRSAVVVYCKTLLQNVSDNFLYTMLKDIANEFPDDGRSLRKLSHYAEKRGAVSRLFSLLEDEGQVAQAVLDGQFAVLLDGWDKAVGFNARSVERRPIKEPESESVINGPREGTVEQLDANIALLRVRLRTPSFKLSIREAGKHTRTRYAVCYLEGAVDQEALDELNSRLEPMADIDIVDTSYIREQVEDARYSPFPQHRITERPDVAVSAMLEGRIVLLSEGSGTMVICPIVFTELFQSAEDYYQRTIISSLIRILRVFAFFLALTLPSLYIALSIFHMELIPTTLLLTIIDTREGVPFPTLIEAVLMQFFFELLREAGIRLPRPIGAAVSIVGALIIGEAAIRAGIASPIMIVVIALTGIASFSLPQYELAIALRILVFPLMILAYLWGGFGLMVGFTLIFLHLTCLRSLGQPYFSPLAPLRARQLLDVFVRLPYKERLKLAMRQKSATKQ